MRGQFRPQTQTSSPTPLGGSGTHIGPDHCLLKAGRHRRQRHPKLFVVHAHQYKFSFIRCTHAQKFSTVWRLQIVGKQVGM